MKFASTRGEAPQVGFSQALLQGLAPDGGLYVPTQWPAVAAGIEAGESLPEGAARETLTIPRRDIQRNSPEGPVSGR